MKSSKNKTYKYQSAMNYNDLRLFILQLTKLPYLKINSMQTDFGNKICVINSWIGVDSYQMTKN